MSFYEHIPQSSPFSLVRFREYERRSSQWYVIRFLNHRILSSCRLMFDRSSGKGKTQIGMAKFHALKGFGEISTPKGVVFRRKNFANPILLPLREPQERTNGDRKTQKKRWIQGNGISSLGTSLHSSWIHIKNKDYGI